MSSTSLDALPSPLSLTEKFKLFFYNNSRGILGSLPLILMPVLLTPASDLVEKKEKTILVVWVVMFTCLLLHPVKVPVVGYVPVFLFPILHITESRKLTGAIFAPNTAFMVVGGFVRKLLNMSGVDKRLAMWVLMPKPETKISAVSLVTRSSIATYFTCMISDRMHVIPFMMETVALPLFNLQSSSAGAEDEPNYAKMRYVVSNAVTTSAVLGSITFVNGCRNVMFMRTLWDMSQNEDTFNCLDYFCFALPVTLVMFVLNLGYNILLVKLLAGKPLSATSLDIYQSSIQKVKERIPPKMSLHEKLTITFAVLSNIGNLTRWGVTMKRIFGIRGWVEFFKNGVDEKGNANIPDVTVSATLTILTAALPTSFNFLKIIKAKDASDLPQAKPDTSILLWRFADKSTNYGYVFLLGGLIALDTAIRNSEVPNVYLYNQFSFIHRRILPVALLIVCLISTLLCNIMTAAGTTGMVLAVVLNMLPPENEYFREKRYLFAMAGGLAASFGFAAHFANTPAVHSRRLVKVPAVKQAKYCIGSCVICTLVLWISLVNYAPMIFEPPLTKKEK